MHARQHTRHRRIHHRVPLQVIYVVVYFHYPRRRRVTVQARACALLVGSVVGPQLVGHQGLDYALRWLPARTVSAVTLLEPVGAGALAALFLGERPEPGAVLGALMALAVVVFIASLLVSGATLGLVLALTSGGLIVASLALLVVCAQVRRPSSVGVRRVMRDEGPDREAFLRLSSLRPSRLFVV